VMRLGLQLCSGAKDPWSVCLWENDSLTVWIPTSKIYMMDQSNHSALQACNRLFL
jgi:hypothetical protein